MMKKFVKKIVKNRKEFYVTGYYSSFKQRIKKIFVPSHPGSLWEKVNNNKWENETFAIFDRFIDEDHSYIDIGAWIGPTALYGCQIARHCYAIEPDPVAFKMLQENINLNPNLKDKITLCRVCIGDICGNIRLGSNSKFGDSMSSMLFDKSAKSVIVRAITLNRFIKMHNIDDCNFIKMDIEGGEVIVLPNIKKYLQKNKPTLHLSLHPFNFKDLKRDSNVITNVLKIYRNIFDNKGELIDLKYLFNEVLLKAKSYDIVATDREWTKIKNKS